MSLSMDTHMECLLCSILFLDADIHGLWSAYYFLLDDFNYTTKCGRYNFAPELKKAHYYLNYFA